MEPFVCSPIRHAPPDGAWFSAMIRQNEPMRSCQNHEISNGRAWKSKMISFKTSLIFMLTPAASGHQTLHLTIKVVTFFTSLKPVSKPYFPFANARSAAGPNPMPRYASGGSVNCPAPRKNFTEPAVTRSSSA